MANKVECLLKKLTNSRFPSAEILTQITDYGCQVGCQFVFENYRTGFRFKMYMPHHKDEKDYILEIGMVLDRVQRWLEDSCAVDVWRDRLHLRALWYGDHGKRHPTHAPYEIDSTDAEEYYRYVYFSGV